MNPTWIVLTPLAAVGIGGLALCWIGRRKDRAWAAGVARRVREREVADIHDRRFLEWLDSQFDSEGRMR